MLKKLARKKIEGIDEKIGILLFVLSISILLFICNHIFNQFVWYDEIFTLNILKNSYLNMVEITSADVHPPLYYIILKSVFKLFYLLKISFNEIILAKIVSMTPLILLIVFSAVKIRKNFGWLSAGIFAFSVVAMPQLLYYGIEIRMYSWALIFVTLSFYYGNQITNTSKVKYWILFTFFSILAAYTHYFAGVGVVIIYLLLFSWLFFKNRKELKKWLLSTITSILLYLPWLFILINQMKMVKNDYWIEPITLSSLQSYLWFILSPFSQGDLSYEWFSSIFVILLLLCIIALFAYYLLKNKEKKDFLALGVVILVGTILFGVIVSIVFKPVFVARYVVPVLSCFWLAFSVLLAKFYSKKQIFIPILMIILIVGAVNLIALVGDEKQNEIIDNQKREILSKITSKDDIIIHTNIGIYKASGYYTKGTNYFFADNQNKCLKKIEKSLNKGKNVWFFTKNDKINEFNKTMIENGYFLEKKIDLGKSPNGIIYPESAYLIKKYD